MNSTLARVAISQSELFREWSEADIARLVEVSDVLRLESGALLHGPGEIVPFLYLIASGSLRMSLRTASNREFAFRLRFAGDFLGLGPLLSGEAFVYTTVCRGQTHLVRIPGPFLKNMLVRNGRLAVAMFAGFNRRHRNMIALYADASTGSLRARLASLLGLIAAASGHAANEIEILQDELAELLATRRQAVNRELRALEKLGVLALEYGRIVIADKTALQELAILPTPAPLP
ncbi:Crp/Fnr family transcriptional regulator [Pigmentiphaga sp.]|uniref:Crp/Fnr family transcriptional regulator n=1 Tax=Pigmentiphaga sp. TaxID=1977564 RepID=UPI00128DEF5E|nr:Crp/Fnr family transcriptional regulator [Pigmentiphaga sp.]MPS28427.1 Crp/Fnr family transcriptional regulator [Alcaligenaceae bacterium SAGV5]MPS52092.1 Crp/Fnr family transcriptional regulator [Alcaligenaceae bacterium SAGV3]MPT56248.1 Crp/Fnr family transcriptional regulator [Alcaligenaceae bacterium]